MIPLPYRIFNRAVDYELGEVRVGSEIVEMPTLRMTDIISIPEIEQSIIFSHGKDIYCIVGRKIDRLRPYSIGKYIIGNDLFFDIESP